MQVETRHLAFIDDQKEKKAKLGKKFETKICNFFTCTFKVITFYVVCESTTR